MKLALAQTSLELLSPCESFIFLKFCLWNTSFWSNLFTIDLLLYIRNCAIWSEMEHVRFPQRKLSSKPFVKMVSIIVLLHGVTFVGNVICADNDAENFLSKNSLLELEFCNVTNLHWSYLLKRHLFFNLLICQVEAGDNYR